jgi:RNA polymerase sigma-70 factor (ECF subfamily)
LRLRIGCEAASVFVKLPPAAALATMTGDPATATPTRRPLGPGARRMQDDAAADAELVRRTVAGDRDAFGALTRRYYRPVGAFLLKRIGQCDLVEDLVQETFLEALRTIREGKPPTHFSSWLFGIAHNRWGKWARRRHTISFSTAAPPEEIPAPTATHLFEEAEEHQHRMGQLESSLAELPDDVRHLLAMKHREGKTCEEIAAATGRPVGTIKSLLARTYRVLRERLAPPGGDRP